ncbi:hypothetical protein GJAV_G00116540 [Gymnothorax javanicus]|nr:hypothetical protein GJAV_G00116540 [Gymnothorax javanicus]
MNVKNDGNPEGLTKTLHGRPKTEVQAANSTGDEDNGAPAPGVTTGDWVWLKALGRPRWDEPIWTGPFKITEVSDRRKKSGSERRR